MFHITSWEWICSRWIGKQSKCLQIYHPIINAQWILPCCNSFIMMEASGGWDLLRSKRFMLWTPFTAAASAAVHTDEPGELKHTEQLAVRVPSVEVSNSYCIGMPPTPQPLSPAVMTPEWQPQLQGIMASHNIQPDRRSTIYHSGRHHWLPLVGKCFLIQSHSYCNFQKLDMQRFSYVQGLKMLVNTLLNCNCQNIQRPKLCYFIGAVMF